MKNFVLLLASYVVALLAPTLYAADYDPFTYSPGNLIGNGSWVDGAGGSGISAGPQIGSDNLSYSGLQTSGGPDATFGAGNENALFNLSGSGTGTWNGSAPQSVYFSYELQLSSAPGTGPFQLTALDQKASGAIGSRGAEVVVQDNGAGTGFYIGLMKGGQNGNNVAGNTAGIAWMGGVTGANPAGRTLYSYNTTLLIVGAYNFLGLTKAQETSNGSDDDTANLWVNPDIATFGAASAPTAGATAVKTASTAKDLGNIASLDLIQADGSANAAPKGAIDDLRIGLSWADVTPDTTPPNPYVTWANGYGLTNSALSAMDYDGDGDGLNNLLEYALGGNPNTNDAATVKPQWAVHGPWLDYSFNRRTNYDALGLDYDVETSTNLAVSSSWTNANYTESIGPAADGFETVTNRIDTRAANSQFIRLQVGYNGYPGIPRDNLYQVKIITPHGPKGIPVFQDACPAFVAGQQGLLASDATALGLHAGQTISWAAFDLNEPITVEVDVIDTNRIHLSDVRIFPSQYQVSPVRDGNTIRFSLQNPAQYSIEIGTNGYLNGLMIFADPPETNAPSRTNSTYAVFNGATQNDLNNLPAGVTGIYFEKGTHNIGIYSIPQQIKNIYLERGAWVDGALILTNNNQGTHIFGRGVLSGRKLNYRSAHGIEASGIDDLTIEGIVVADFKYFALRLISTDTTVSWVKTIGAWTWNADGISVWDNSVIDHCFIWANDDAIKPYRPNITFSNIEVWQLDNGGTIQMSWGDADSDNVVITNLDVLHAEWDHPGFNRGLLCCVGNRYQTPGITSFVSNWRIENVLTETPVPNIFQITPDPFSTVNIQNLTLRNWNVAMPMNTAFTNQIIGNAVSQPFSGFVFDHFDFNGTNLTQPNWQTQLQITPVNLATPVVQ
ncbi:MAG TPA: hypothetical protein VGO57_11750 [Verrucomicrobiae bacterium]|jgi:hypothetical protein